MSTIPSVPLAIKVSVKDLNKIRKKRLAKSGINSKKDATKPKLDLISYSKK